MSENKKHINVLNSQELKEVFYYDETAETCLRYKKDGSVAGKQQDINDSYSRYVVYHNKKLLKVHRIILALHDNEHINDASYVIDHIDQNSLNNKIDNLRIVTHKQNLHNARMYKNNTSGHTGVILETRKNGYKRYVTSVYQVDGKVKRYCFPFYKYNTESDALEAALSKRAYEISQIGDYTESHGK